MKNITRIFASGLLKLTLFWAAIIASIVGMAGSPATLKQSLGDSGVYDSLVSNALQATDKPEEAKSEEEKQQGVSLDQAQIKTAAESALPPETLQSSAEQIIDGVFRWLNGEVETPDFRVDLTEPKQRFIAVAGLEAEKHVAGLPVCTAAESRAMDPEADAFGMTCRPATLSAATVRQQFESKLAGNEDFLKDPVITADSLGRKEGEASIFEKAEGARNGFQQAKVVPWLLLAVSALLAAAVFFLGKTRRQGAKSLAITLLGTGLFLLLTTWLTSLIFSRLIQPDGAIGKSINNSLQTSILAVLSSLGKAFSNTALVYALSYTLIGLAALLALKFIWKKEDTPVTVENNQPVETLPAKPAKK